MLVYIILIAALGLVLAWNFIPAVRAKFKGMTTILEVIMGTVLYYANVFGAAVTDMKASGLVPAELEGWLPYILAGYIVVKRLVTSTPVGHSK